MNVQSVDIKHLINLSHNEVKERMRRNMQQMAKRYQEKGNVKPKL